MITIPRWTDNPNFNAQAAHFGVGYGAAMTATKFAHLSLRLLAVSVIYIACTGLKEFVYDANFEIPPQSNIDNLIDFLYYTLGYTVGTIVGIL